MDTPMSTPGNIVPHQDSLMDTAAVTAVIHKFKNLEIRDRGTFSGQCDIHDPVSIIKPFESLDIGSGCHRQIGHDSVLTTAAKSIRTRPHTKRVHITIQRPIRHPVMHPDISSNSIGGPEDDLSERNSGVPDLDEWTDCLKVRQAVSKKGKRRTMAARKSTSKGPTRKKIGGVRRHRRARPRPWDLSHGEMLRMKD